MKVRNWMMVGAVALVALVNATVQAAVTIDMVTVGNAGNAPDIRVMRDGTTGYGSVNHTYNISKCEITAGQYTEFLNAVAAASDPYGLYQSSMAAGVYGSKITKSGSIYTATLPNEPANYVSWGDVARFCNWLCNGQPSGVEGPGTTETGAYALNGGTSSAALAAVTRTPGAAYWIPTENEWYKAAYYDPNYGGPGVGGYWSFPTKSWQVPTNKYPSSSTNNVNYSIYDGEFVYTLGVSPWTTPVGSFANSLSAYGTLDQGGNVWEWNEAVISAYGYLYRGIRGGGFDDYGSVTPRCDFRGGYDPVMEYNWNGFRVASVPEPSTLGLLGISAIGVLVYAWRRRKTA
jgi:formylglycine-generating enzyme